ncbi:DUF2779 domain-containing protein [Leptospira gomenensis]|uniref:DUF2779 domain-containing protein n=2 Tax=Leptospira gomenensis TaxID=2484974 RepID=A0A5F1Z2S9_9LEPT|nr:DUF2779 domain-containing protein [Leptospira gomenensis]TGK40043.1 DUF2779 domain-containing protein [Leptospira gomenensis]TGK51493.1 DUF2779 domain-containing protein [Leptospira gomenensis]TGK68050.1 DUF2779 domain-containing protein [Leptospira gomenensis]
MVRFSFNRPVEEIPKLTKAGFTTGLYCEYHLWLNTYEPRPDFDPFEYQYISPKQKSLLRELSHSLFPESKNARYNESETRRILKSGLGVRSACLETDKFSMKTEYVLPDRQVENAFELVVLKASSSFKKQHITEVAFQKFVAEECGFPISKCTLLFVNSKYPYREEIEPEFFFVKKDITSEVAARYGETKERAFSLYDLLSRKNLPPRSVSRNCAHPRNCVYPEICLTPEVPGDIFTLREGKEESGRFYKEGIFHLKDIRNPEGLTSRQKIQIETAKTGIPYVNHKVFVEFLKRIKFPIHFLDFESINPPIPVYPDSNPFQHVPFLFSLHVLRQDLTEEPESFHYIDDGTTDPRKGILEKLQQWISPGGTVLCYNDKFEKRCLEESAAVFPEFKPWLKSIENDFVDLAKPFWEYEYYHPDQKGSTSLKTILPVITGKSYRDLNIKSGQTANAEFLRLKTETVSEEEKRKIENSLIEYCKLDTYAMVLILRKIREWIETV